MPGTDTPAGGRPAGARGTNAPAGCCMGGGTVLKIGAAPLGSTTFGAGSSCTSASPSSFTGRCGGNCGGNCGGPPWNCAGNCGGNCCGGNCGCAGCWNEFGGGDDDGRVGELVGITRIRS